MPSLAARQLIEEKLLDIIGMIFQDLDNQEYFRVEGEIFDKVMNHDFMTVLVSKIDINARILAIMALELIAEDMDLKKLRKEFLNGQREIQEKEQEIREAVIRAEHGIII